jgi:hypothetical protein
MADDKTGWSEKGRASKRGKRPPRDAGDEATESKDLVSTEAATPTRPSKRESSSSSSDSAASTVTRVPATEDGARKVAKAAAAAGQRDVSFASRLGFPALVALVCLLGTMVVVLAWTTRDALPQPIQGVDHWHSVYGVYDCTLETENKYLPPFLAERDETGIHSHGDGIMHIHPFFELSSGDNAQMRHFFSEMGVEAETDRIVLDNGRELIAGTECADGSGPATVQIHEWDFDFQALAGEPANTIYREDPGLVRFKNDRQVFVIAFAAEDTELVFTEEDNALRDRFDLLNNVSAAIEYNPAGLAPQDSGITVEVDGEDSGDVEIEIIEPEEGDGG